MMPLPVLGKVIGEVVKEAAVDAVKPQRAGPRKKKPSGNAKNKKKNANWIVLIAAAVILLFVLRHLR
jgi:hypothetical protein